MDMQYHKFEQNDKKAVEEQNQKEKKELQTIRLFSPSFLYL